MYSFKQKGKWLDCDICNSPHREIIQDDLVGYIDKDTMENVSLSDEERVQCFKCKPIKLYYKFDCNNCHTSSIIETYFNSPKTTICPLCLTDNNKLLSKSPAIVESIPKLDGGAKELFNRIKKRNIGSNMPDY